MEQLGACGVTVVCSPSGSNGRSGVQRGGLGRRSGDGTGRAACSSWKAMSGSTARREAGLTSGSRLAPRVPGSTACVRELGSVWLSPSDRRGVAAGGGSKLGRAGGAAARSALLCRAGTEKRERGGKREKREKEVNQILTRVCSNFCVKTQKTFHTKVVGNCKDYNFHFS